MHYTLDNTLDAVPLRLNSESFWQFSLTFYPNVKTVCLRWQNEYQANVNVLLALCYAEYLAWQVVPASLPSALVSLQTVNLQLTQTLRHCRGRLTDLPISTEQHRLLKESLLNCELVAESVEQHLICQSLHFRPQVQPYNLEHYSDTLESATAKTLTDDIVDLRQALVILKTHTV
ncbi:DUF2390 domain-containing protein [Alishewanella tabrizica]|uniref:TIGR02444 family protein n=1 Tax=Alishewanella tabrizica TaxID=671278 RepID=A0ABQ2WRU3_9ALTE|nr:DUF2390 domain-containing protein [Alishewanella tabrizica]GGW68488.1 hypothetical protein GCM10008111_25560 [Alishewanella tabrizica]